MRVLIVDDEPPARRRLARMVAEIQNMAVVGEAADGLEALDRISALAPDVVLLDIRMPGLDGISLAQRSTSLPPLIFVTAYDEFAVQAFEVNAVDYLLKPVRPERLAQALGRVETRAPQRATVEKTLELIAPPAPGRVMSTARGVIRFFDATTITRFWASEKYTLFCFEGQEHLTEETLGSLEARLANLGFVRTHRAELVNAKRVRALRYGDGITEVELDDGQLARVSRRLAPDVRRLLGL